MTVRVEPTSAEMAAAHATDATRLPAQIIVVVVDSIVTVDMKQTARLAETITCRAVVLAPAPVQLMTVPVELTSVRTAVTRGTDATRGPASITVVVVGNTVIVVMRPTVLLE